MAGMERFTQRARQVLTIAHAETERLKQPQIGTEHLLLGLIIEDGGIASRVLTELGLDRERVTETVERLTGFGTGASDHIELHADTKQAIENAITEAQRLGHPYIGTEHLLLGLVRMESSTALDVLRKLGVTSEQV